MNKPNRTIAILLALFLGGFGAHKFYMGKPGLGLLYFFFCWTYIPSVIALIELIIYAVISEKEFQKRYWNQLK